MNAPSSSSFDDATITVEAAAAAAAAAAAVVLMMVALDRGKNHDDNFFGKEWSLAPSIFNIKARGFNLIIVLY